MKTLDDQLSEVMLRSERIKKQKVMSRIYGLTAVAAVLAIAIISVAVLNVSNIGSNAVAVEPEAYGSLLLGGSGVAEIVMAGLAFMLGVCVTLLCVCIKKKNEVIGQ